MNEANSKVRSWLQLFQSSEYGKAVEQAREWTDLSAFAELKEIIEDADDITRRNGYVLLMYMGRNTSSVEIAEYLMQRVAVERIKKDKEELLRHVRILDGVRDSRIARELVEDKMASLAYQAVWALGACVDAEAEDTLLGVIENKPNLHIPAVDALQRVGTKKSVPSLVKLIQATDNGHVRRSALQAVRKIDAEPHLDLFVDVFQSDRNPESKWHCLVAIREFGTEDHIDLVVKRLETLAKKKNRTEEYSGGPIIAPKNIRHLMDRGQEDYATEFTLGIDFLNRFDNPSVESFWQKLHKNWDRLLPSEQTHLMANVESFRAMEE